MDDIHRSPRFLSTLAGVSDQQAGIEMDAVNNCVETIAGANSFETQVSAGISSQTVAIPLCTASDSAGSAPQKMLFFDVINANTTKSELEKDPIECFMPPESYAGVSFPPRLGGLESLLRPELTLVSAISSLHPSPRYETTLGKSDTSLPATPLNYLPRNGTGRCRGDGNGSCGMGHK